jgi:single-stranded-DNA-specific exonuclease
LDKFGGHEMAAGISISEKRLSDFRDAFEAAARRVGTDEMLVPRLQLDCEVTLRDIDYALMESQDLLEPFGAANSQPVFFSCGVTPASTPRVMKEKHLRLEFAAGRSRVSAVYFNARLDALPRPPWDIAYTLEWNHWNGRSEPQLKILEVRCAA